MTSMMTSTAKPLESVNDFVIKFANVNGTGSASANNLFAKALFRMGLPVSPKNIFPSNIQGLPTWYEVRVSEKGYLGRRGGIAALDFDGKAATVRSASGDAASCVIDCEGDGRGFYFHSGEGPDSIVEGLTITTGWSVCAQ
mgnify:CR=1 FL=1